jgi:hypothetical protein
MSLHSRPKRPDRRDRAERTEGFGRRLASLARLRAERANEGSLCARLPCGAQRSNRRHTDPGVDTAAERRQGREGCAAAGEAQRTDGLQSHAASTTLERRAEHAAHRARRGTDESGDRLCLNGLVEPEVRRQREQRRLPLPGQRRSGPQAHRGVGIPQGGPEDARRAFPKRARSWNREVLARPG